MPARCIFFVALLSFLQLSFPSFGVAETTPSEQSASVTSTQSYPVWWMEDMVQQYQAPRGFDRTKIWHGESSPTGIAMTSGQKKAVVALMVSSGWGSYSPFCTGTLVNDRVIISAAHCIHQCDDYGNNCQDVQPYWVRIGMGDNLNNPDQMLTVSQIQYHPSYTGAMTLQTAYYDVSVLILSSSVSSIEPIPYNRSDIPSTLRNSTVQAGGYGMTHTTQNNLIKYWATLSLMQISSMELVAGDPNYYSGVCSGDSGGPLLHNFEGFLTLIGTTSWGIANECNQPAHFSRLDAHKDWLENLVGPYDPVCTDGCDGVECGYINGCYCGGCDDGLACNANQCLPEGISCDTMGSYGCCDDSTLYRCENGQYASTECGSQGCGWVNNQQGYGCGADGVQDPSGRYPLYCDGSADCDQLCETVDCGEKLGCQCGLCHAGESCQDNICVPEGATCTDLCSQVDCGGYAGCECGLCGGDKECRDNLCVTQGVDCTDVCSSVECGEYQGCQCGLCTDNRTCQNNQCISNNTECLNACEEVDCGSYEGCECGLCSGDLECRDNQCVDPNTPVGCSGTCTEADKDSCQEDGQTLCSCRDGQWTELDCPTECSRYSRQFVACIYLDAVDEDVCQCQAASVIPTDGDTTDPVDGDTGDEPGNPQDGTDGGCSQSANASTIVFAFLLLTVILRRRNRENV